jgi:hypothetical protein
MLGESVESAEGQQRVIETPAESQRDQASGGSGGNGAGTKARKRSPAVATSTYVPGTGRRIGWTKPQITIGVI